MMAGGLAAMGLLGGAAVERVGAQLVAHGHRVQTGRAHLLQPVRSKAQLANLQGAEWTTSVAPQVEGSKLGVDFKIYFK